MQNVSYQLLGYQRLVLEFSVSTVVKLRNNKGKIVQAKEKLRKVVESSEELEKPW